METPIPHGTIGGYTNYACRCDLCKQAQKDYRAKRRALDPEGVKAKAREQMRRSRERRIQEDREAYLKKAAEQQAEWRKNNPERWKEIDRAGKEKEKALHPERVKERNRKSSQEWKEKNPEGYERNRKKKAHSVRVRRYHLTLEEYAALFESQGGVCALCGNGNTQTRGDGFYALHIDHCHETGRVRGLLCSNCNLGLGKFKDDASLLKKAIEYLERP